MAELIGEQFTFHGYEITTDTSFHHERYGVTPDLAVQLENAALGCHNKMDKRMVEKLTNLVLQYPHIPMFKNYLMVAYRVHGNRLKADEISDRIIQEHPDYLFGKINQAHNFIESGETEKVPMVLGESLELKDLYPERKIFHYAEYTKYLNVVIMYYVAVKNLELAELKLNMLAEIAPDDPVTEQAESYLWMLRLERVGKRLEEEHKQRITPVPFKHAPESGRNTPPVFNHSEINNLYRYGMGIPNRVLEEILTLQRQTLTEDLLTLLNDAADRYHFFSKGSGDGNATYFPIHALFLLMELKAEETLPAVLSFLEYDNDFQEFWLGDHRTNTVWRCIFQLGRNNPDLLQQFLQKSGIDTYSKTLVTDALCQMVLHHPEIRPTVLDLFSAVFKTFAESEIGDNLIDTDFLGLAIGSSIDCRLKELLPLVKILFEKQYVALQISGDYSEVEKEFNSTPKHDRKKTILSVFELYDKEAKNRNYTGGKDMLMNNPSHSNIQQSVIQSASDKIGRNDPCPCGSGRKYKKCCMK